MTLFHSISLDILGIAAVISACAICAFSATDVGADSESTEFASGSSQSTATNLVSGAKTTNPTSDSSVEAPESLDGTPQPPASVSSAREVVRQFLSKMDVLYREIPKGTSRTLYRYHLSVDDEHLEEYPVVVDIDEACGWAVCSATLPFTIPEEVLPAVGELAAKWTQDTPMGQFGVDFPTHGFFFMAKMPIEFLRLDDLPSFFSFLFVPSMYVAQKDAEVRAVAAGARPRAVGGTANENEEDNWDGVPADDEGASAENTTGAPPLIDESLVKDAISRWLDDKEVELFFNTDTPGSATYRFDMKVADEPGPFSTVQIMLRFSGAWVYADAAPRVHFPVSRRRDILNAIAKESVQISNTSLYWLEGHRCYVVRAVLPANAVARNPDYTLKWLLDRAGDAANKMGGRFAQFLTEDESTSENIERESP